MNGRDDLSEEMSGLALSDALFLAEVVVQISFTGVLHHDHDLLLVLKHWNTIRSAVVVYSGGIT